MYDSGPEEEIKPPATQATLVTIKNAHLVEEKLGKRNWELNADTMQADALQQVNNLTGVKGKLFLENGNIVDVTADKGVMYLKSKDITLSGNVLIITSQAEKLVAKDLKFTNLDNTIIATGDVVITKPGLLAQADQVITDRSLEKIKLIGKALVRKGGE